MAFDYQDAEGDKFSEALDFLSKKYFGENAMYIASICAKDDNGEINGSTTHASMPPHIAYQVVSHLAVDLESSGDVPASDKKKFGSRKGMSEQKKKEIRNELEKLVISYEGINLAEQDLPIMNYLVDSLSLIRKLSIAAFITE